MTRIPARRRVRFSATKSKRWSWKLRSKKVVRFIYLQRALRSLRCICKCLSEPSQHATPTHFNAVPVNKQMRTMEKENFQFCKTGPNCFIQNCRDLLLPFDNHSIPPTRQCNFWWCKQTTFFTVDAKRENFFHLSAKKVKNAKIKKNCKRYIWCSGNHLDVCHEHLIHYTWWCSEWAQNRSKFIHYSSTFQITTIRTDQNEQNSMSSKKWLIEILLKQQILLT